MPLPPNAHRRLKPGEKYIPLIPDNKDYKQISPYSFILGMFFVVLFTGASAFLGVKIAQVPEASMSVALIAMVLAKVIGRKNSILENVMIQSMASVSTGVAAGAIFVLPAIYILGLETASFTQMFLACSTGAVLAIIFTILVRRYYIVDQHGVYPYPEATVAAETLSVGESVSKTETNLIFLGLAFGGILDMLNYYFGAWKSVYSTSLMPFFDKVADKAKLILNYDTSAAVLGMGYVVGLNFALIICVSCFVGYWLFVPFFAHFADQSWLMGFIPQTILDKGNPLAMDPDKIFTVYVRPIGIGTFFTAGLVSILMSGKTIVKSIGQSFSAMSLKGDQEEQSRDLKGSLLIGILAITLIAIFGFFYFSLLDQKALITILILAVGFGLIVAFMPAAILATIMMGNAPVSGMTIVCLVFACLILAATGFAGKSGMLVAVLFGTFMCTSLAFGSSFITDLKIGYWLGSTPAKQEGMKIISALVSVVVVVFSMYIINQQYGFIKSDLHPNAVAAPQANAMANIILTFLGGGTPPWYFYGFGALLALVMRFKFGISPLAVALGLYIPIEYNVPLLAGALIAHQVSKTKSGEPDNKMAKERENRGLMLATGFVAAGSIAGILSAALKYFGLDPGKYYVLFADHNWSNWISFIVLIVMAWFLYKISNQNTENKLN